MLCCMFHAGAGLGEEAGGAVSEPRGGKKG